MYVILTKPTVDLIAKEIFPAYYHLARTPGKSSEGPLSKTWREEWKGSQVDQLDELKKEAKTKMANFSAEQMEGSIPGAREPSQDGIFLQENTDMVAIPFLTFFVQLSPTSKVAVSPKVNNRNVDRNLYKQNYSVEEGTSFEASLTKAFGTNLQRFNMSCYPYTIDKGYEMMCHLQSFSTRTVDNKIYVVEVEASPSYVEKEDFDTTMKLFNQKVPEDVDWYPLFSLVGKMNLSTIEDIDQFMQVCDLPTSIFDAFDVTTDNGIQHYDTPSTYFEKLDQVRHFIQLCTNVRFSFPEGQHCMEAAVRVLYGFNLQQEDCIDRNLDFELNPQNSLFLPINTLVLKLPQEEIKRRMTQSDYIFGEEQVFKELVAISRRYAKEANTTFKGSHRGFMYQFLVDIGLEVKREQGTGLVEKPQFTNPYESEYWRGLTFSIKRRKGAITRIDMDPVYERQKAFLLKLTERILEGGTPYSESLKNEVTVEKIEEVMGKNDWNWFGGAVKYTFTHPYRNVSSPQA